MKEAEILSVLPSRFDAGASDTAAPGGTAQAPRESPAATLVWETCHLGVLLRAVLFVQAVTAVAALYAVPSGVEGLAPALQAWGIQWALLTGATLPATLAWVLGTCALKRPLSGWPRGVQWAVGLGLGALAGVGGGAFLWVAGALPTLPWVVCAASGALLAALLVAGLQWRAQGRTPADTRARLAELQSRIRPHFLFNTLNSAIALVRAEPERAEALLEDLSELFRHALSDRQQAVPLAQEIELARRYLDIESVRFGERLRVQWQIDPAADAALLPPLILQPLVENAVRHGVEPSASGADLRIRTERRGDVVVLKVTNTVPAGAGPAGQGLALDNVRQRLSLLHDVQARFSAGQREGVFRVRLEWPAPPRETP